MAEAQKRTIAIDAMGGDKGPEEVVKAVRLALNKGLSHLSLVLVGQEDLLRQHLKAHRLEGEPRVSVAHASEVIGMDEKGVAAYKRKKDSSMVRAIEMVKDGRAQAAVSCGNTSALTACSTLSLRRLPGVERPALASVWPSRQQHFVILDVGANPASEPEHFVHNAVLGSHFCRLTLGRERPRTGLLSIGTEESKGHKTIQQANELLRAVGDLINYKGPIEGFDVFENEVDVIVCDGFTGNVLLKTCESLSKTLRSIVKDEVLGKPWRHPWRMAGGVLIRGAFKNVKERLNPDRYAGAPLLGLQGNVIKSHGSSNMHGIASAIRIAGEFVEYDMTAQARDDIATANERMAARKTKAPTEGCEKVKAEG